MGRMQRAKGAQGERELCAQFAARGYTARRYAPLQALQRGEAEAPDIVVRELPQLWIECKRMKRVAVMAAWRQAMTDVLSSHADQSVPLVAFREDHGEWMACLRLGDLLDLIADAQSSGKES